MTETIGGAIAIVLTLLVFSRLFGDNVVFRAIQYLFVGVSLGLAFVVLYYQVLSPSVLRILRSGTNTSVLAIQLVPFLLGLLLLPRAVGRQGLSWLAIIPLGIIFGVATALALGGALVGTLGPQILDTAQPAGNTPLQLVGTVVLALGVVLTLCYFYFTVPRTTPVGQVVALGARAGRWLLIVAFGVFLSGALLTYLTALNERLTFVVGWFSGLVQ